jgi:hypothetical protein
LKIQEVKAAIKSFSELSDSYMDFKNLMSVTAEEAAATQKLWREGNKSKLMSIGMAVFLFPEPTPISEIVGTGIMAAGLIQKSLKNRAIYLEDIPKTFLKTCKELRSARYDF